MVRKDKHNWKTLLIWMLGTVFAALLAMILSFVPNPFDADCEINKKVFNLSGAKVRLYHSMSKQGLAAAIEMKLQSCGANVEVTDNNHKTSKANVRYYVENDFSIATDIQIILNSVAGNHPNLGIRFVVNPRLEANKKDRNNVFHVYF